MGPFSASLPLSDASISGNSWVRIVGAALFSAAFFFSFWPLLKMFLINNRLSTAVQTELEEGGWFSFREGRFSSRHLSAHLLLKWVFALVGK